MSKKELPQYCQLSGCGNQIGGNCRLHYWVLDNWFSRVSRSREYGRLIELAETNPEELVRKCQMDT